MKPLLACLAALCLCACDRAAPRAKLETAQFQAPQYQRFIPLPEVNSSVFGSQVMYGFPRPFFALDATTGQMCRTFEFSMDKANSIQQTMAELPTCDSLYVLSEKLRDSDARAAAANASWTSRD